MVYFTSDLHFGCENLRRETRPEFSSIEEHDAAILDGINSAVDRNDRLIILGDFCLKKPGRYRPKIKCRQIFFILGNHDQPAKIRAVFGHNVWDTKLVKVADKKVWCSHYPHAAWPENHYGSYHAHGHLHYNPEHEWVMDQAFPERRSMDVGVDSAKLMLGEWRPFSEEEFFHLLADRAGHGLITR